MRIHADPDLQRSYLCEDPAEHLGWDGVDLVQDHDAPFLLLDPLHRLLGLPATLLRIPAKCRHYTVTFSANNNG